MTDWKYRFEELRSTVSFPDAPDSENLRTAIRIVDDISDKIALSNLLLSPETKVIIKCPASSFQKNHFPEVDKYVFRFQSLLDGRKSQIISNKMRPELGILDRYTTTGGPYPEEFEMEVNKNYSMVNNHYLKLRCDFYSKVWTINRQYYIQVHGQPQSWWDVYNEYLNSPEWGSKKKIVHDKYNDKCGLCESKMFLQVHHIHYKNVGNENIEDLILVCKTCHEQIHGRSL